MGTKSTALVQSKICVLKSKYTIYSWFEGLGETLKQISQNKLVRVVLDLNLDLNGA